MRGTFADQGGLFSYISPDRRVPANHPLRKVRELVRDVLSEMNRGLGKLYASEGRPSIPPEQLLSALLLQVFYGIRSERQFMEQLDYNLLYRWFVGLSPDDPDLGSNHFHEEPRPAAERRGVCEVHDRASEPCAGQAAVVGRTFFGRWNADRGLGFAEELSSQGRQRRRRWRRELPWPDAQERHPCEHERSRQPPLPQGRRARGEALLYGPRHHGEPARAGGGRHGHARQWHRRTPRFG